MRIVVVAETDARFLVAILLIIVTSAAESEAPSASAGLLVFSVITLLLLFATAAVPISVTTLGLPAGSVAVAALQLPVKPFRGRNDRRGDRRSIIFFILASDTATSITSNDAYRRCEYKCNY